MSHTLIPLCVLDDNFCYNNLLNKNFYSVVFGLFLILLYIKEAASLVYVPVHSWMHVTLIYFYKKDNHHHNPLHLLHIIRSRATLHFGKEQ